MKRIKALSALIVLILCTTIGSVYATWNYSFTDDIADVYGESKVIVSDVSLVGANGTFTISSNLILEIDQRDDDHYAQLLFKSNNGEPVQLVITFTPAAAAPAHIKQNAVPAELYWSCPASKYTMDKYGNYADPASATITKDIFVFNNVANDQLDNIFEWTAVKDGEGNITHFTHVLDEAALREAIKLNVFAVTDANDEEKTITDTFRLDTKAEHDKFHACLEGMNVVARVTDGTVNA